MSKSADWSAIRAEYIAGGISQRKLAAKYGVSFNTLKDRANAERWAAARTETYHNTTTEAQQRIVVAKADAAADNATIAESIKKNLLLLLQRTAESFPKDATEIKTTAKGKTVKYSLKDLTSAYKDLTSDMTQGSSGASELLQALYDMEHRHD